jgi:hypothetical protein
LIIWNYIRNTDKKVAAREGVVFMPQFGLIAAESKFHNIIGKISPDVFQNGYFRQKI